MLVAMAALAGVGCTGRSDDNLAASSKEVPTADKDSTAVNGIDQPAIPEDESGTPLQQITVQSNDNHSLPLCEDSVSDPDGDGYGYENGTSCLTVTTINNDSFSINPADALAQPISTPTVTQVSDRNWPICNSPYSDNDGDGYGYENDATCVTESVVVQSQGGVGSVSGSIDTNELPNNLQRVTDVILTAGQSNAFANGTRFEPDIYPEDRIDDRILVWTQNNGWKIANPLTQIWEHDKFPARPWDPGTSSNSPGFQIARAIVNADPDRVVAFIPTSSPGQAIHHWRYGATPYNTIKQRVENALNDIPHKYQLDLIWWMQGESDANASDYYRNRLNELLNNWRSEPWYGADKYFIANETISFEVNQIFHELRNDDDPYTDYSAAAGLPSIQPNGVHFNSSSYRIIGNRVQQVYLDMRRTTGNR